MSTRCRPGDIAIIVRGSAHQVLGRLVTVLHAAPAGEFSLPDGMKHQPLSFAVYRDWWVCEFQTPVDVPLRFGTRRTVFAPVPDARLLPIRDPGDDADLETDTPIEREKEVA